MTAPVSTSMAAVLARVSSLEASFGLRRPATPVAAPSPDLDFDSVLQGTLGTGAASAAGTIATGLGAVGATPYDALFAAAGARHGVDPALLAAVARTESGLDPQAVSPAGAQGLMQLMPATAAGLGVTDSFDPAQAVDGAARLLRGHLDRFGSLPLALAAYNAGAGAVSRHGGIPPYPETQQYVQRVLSHLGAA